MKKYQENGATAGQKDAATSGEDSIVAAATAGHRDAATSGEDSIAAAATAGQKDAATSGQVQTATAATTGQKDAATSGEDSIAAAATAGQKDTATSGQVQTATAATAGHRDAATSGEDLIAAAATAGQKDAATSGQVQTATAATAGHRDAATSGEVIIAAAATAGQRGAATPLEQRSEDPEHARIRHEVQDQGEWRQQRPLATRGRHRFFFHTAPETGGVASGQTHQNVRNLVSLLPSPSGSSCAAQQTQDGRRRRRLLQLISRRHPRAGVRDDSGRSHLMIAQRGNFHLAGHLRTGGRTPHFFEIGEKCEKPLETAHLQSERRDADDQPSEQRERRPSVPAKSNSL